MKPGNRRVRAHTKRCQILQIFLKDEVIAYRSIATSSVQKRFFYYYIYLFEIFRIIRKDGHTMEHTYTRRKQNEKIIHIRIRY